MAIYVAKDNASGALAAQCISTDLTLSVVSATGDNFPVCQSGNYTYLTLYDASGNIEVVKVTSRATASDTMTIVRAQFGTAARTWPAATPLQCRPVAGLYQDSFNHILTTPAAHTASAITNVPAGDVAATDVQTAINELDTDKYPKTGGALSGSVSVTGNVSATGAVSGASVAASGAVTGASATVTGQVAAGNLSLSGGTGAIAGATTISASGAVSAGSLALSGAVTGATNITASGATSTGTLSTGATTLTGQLTVGGSQGTSGVHVLVSKGAGTPPAWGVPPSALQSTTTGTGPLTVSSPLIGGNYAAAHVGPTVDYWVCNEANTEWEVGTGTMSFSNSGDATGTDGVSTPGSGSGIAYGAGVFAGGDKYSTDGVNWSAASGTNADGPIAYGDGWFLSRNSASRSSLIKSADGITWSFSVTTFTSGDVVGVANTPGRWVAVLQGSTVVAYATTTNIDTWPAFTYLAGSGSWYSRAFGVGNGLFVWVIGGATAPGIYTSSDGSTWTLRQSITDSGDVGYAYGNATHVVVTDTQLFTSADGVTWTSRTRPPYVESYCTLAYLDLFYLGHNGTGGGDYYTSSDGVTWTEKITAGTRFRSASGGSVAVSSNKIVTNTMMLTTAPITGCSLARAPTYSSNSNALVSFSAGTKNVFFWGA